MNNEPESARLFQAAGWSTPAQWTPPAPEDVVIPGIEITGFAGRGGMGAVYSGRQVNLDRTVAVKILPTSLAPIAIARERFLREARVLASWDHPHILRVFDAGEISSGGLYLVMEWAGGGDLRGHSRASLQQVLTWISGIADGLDCAHQAGVIHRDLKPANLLLDDRGCIKIGDFGLAAVSGVEISVQLTMSGTTMGTIDYMAPEQFQPGAAITAQSDIFALGVLTYELLTGRLPKGAFPLASKIAGVPRSVDAVLAQALSPDPALRHASAGEFSRALHKSAKRRNRILIPLMLGILLAGALAILASRPKTSGINETAAEISTAPAIATPSQSPQPTPEVAQRPSEVPAVPVESPPPSIQPTPLATPTSTPQATPPPTQEWTSLLPEINVIRDTRSGAWTKNSAGLRSDSTRCVLQLPVNAGLSYDIRARFTRIEGVHSVAFFLPTSAGPATFDIDAWERGIGGLQDINGQDMRAHGNFFEARLENGVEQSVLIEVRPNRIRGYWNDVLVLDHNLAGLRLSITPLWRTDSPALPGIGSWSSPTAFEAIDFRHRDATAN